MSKNKKILIIVIAILLIAVVLYFVFRKKPIDNTLTQLPPDNFSGGSGSIAPPIAGDAFPLERGDKGTNVRRLQTALNRIKPTNKIAEDGIYGNSTYVKLVQSVATSLYGPEGSVSESQLNHLIMLGNNA